MGRLLIALAVIALAAAGCGSDQGTSTESTDTPDGSTPTVTAGPTTLAGPQPVQWPAEGEPWDLLYISDSGGWGVADVLAERASQELGVEVRVYDHASGGLSAVTALGRVRGEEYPDISDWVRQSEIIIVYGNPEDSGVDTDMGIGTCVSTSVMERDAPPPGTAADYQPYSDILADLYAEIWKLREGAPTVLRAIDLYNPVISAWREAGIESECTAHWELWSSVIRDAAEAHGAVMVSTYDLFNGTAHDEDPREKGYIGPDGEHTTAEGAAAIADAIAAEGFSPSNPPGE
jgi:hypothetical protein